MIFFFLNKEAYFPTVSETKILGCQCSKDDVITNMDRNIKKKLNWVKVELVWRQTETFVTSKGLKVNFPTTVEDWKGNFSPILGLALTFTWF